MDIKRINKDEIIQKLKELGYENKLITYKELQQLHKEYGMGMTETTFAQDILGISYSHYNGCKTEGSRAKILKTKYTEEEKNEIIEKLKSKGYENKLITHEEFLEIYNEYGKINDELIFAREILGIEDHCYYKFKNKGGKTNILKFKYTEEEKGQIIEKLKELGYENKSITYNEFQELYKVYGRGMTETTFAQDILQIEYHCYNNFKKRGTKTKILKFQDLPDENKNNIIKKLKELGYNKKIITYEELQQLYKEHGNGMSESTFAHQILDIEVSLYQKCKSGITKKVKILKSNFIEQNEKEKIIKELKKIGYENKLVTHQEIEKLYQTYSSKMSKREFVEKILGQSYENYKKRRIKNLKIRILKYPKLPEETKVKIIKILKAKGYENKLITYEELQQLYKEYGSGMSETTFREAILNVSDSSYFKCKSGNNIKILKPQYADFTQDEKDKIIEELKQKGYENKLVGYEEIDKLYENYSDKIRKKFFIENILGASYSGYRNSKTTGYKIGILKPKFIILSQQEKDEIINKIIKLGYIDRSITYDDIQQLYKEYGSCMSEINFAREILGVNNSSYTNCKNMGVRVRAKNYSSVVKAEEIKLLYLKTPQYYSKEFINNICNEYNLTLEEFMIYILNCELQNVNLYVEHLKQKDKLWIGYTNLSTEFINNNIDIINDLAYKIVNRFYRSYKINYPKEDLIQDMILEIIAQTGYHEKNFSCDIETYRKTVYKVAYQICEHKVFKIIKEGNSVGIVRHNKKEDKEYELQLKDKDIDIETEIINRITREEFLSDNALKYIEILKELIEYGIDENKAIEIVSEKFNIDKIKLLGIIKDYYIKQNNKVLYKK